MNTRFKPEFLLLAFQPLDRQLHPNLAMRADKPSLRLGHLIGQRQTVDAVVKDVKFVGHVLFSQRGGKEQRIAGGHEFVIRRVPEEGGRRQGGDVQI